MKNGVFLNLVRQLHREFIRAGADVLQSMTYGGTEEHLIEGIDVSNGFEFQNDINMSFDGEYMLACVLKCSFTGCRKMQFWNQGNFCRMHSNIITIVSLTECLETSVLYQSTEHAYNVNGYTVILENT